jgi:hypothetical protein
MKPFEEKVAADIRRVKEGNAKSKQNAHDRAMSSNHVLALSFESIFESQCDVAEAKLEFDVDAILAEARTQHRARLRDYFEHFDSCTVLSVKRDAESARAIVKDTNGATSLLTLTSEHKTWKVTGMPKQSQKSPWRAFFSVRSCILYRDTPIPASPLDIR